MCLGTEVAEWPNLLYAKTLHKIYLSCAFEFLQFFEKNAGKGKGKKNSEKKGKWRTKVVTAQRNQFILYFVVSLFIKIHLTCVKRIRQLLIAYFVSLYPRWLSEKRWGAYVIHSWLKMATLVTSVN